MDPASREARTWISIAVLSIALGVGGLSNLQTVMTNVGRTLAQQEGVVWAAATCPGNVHRNKQRGNRSPFRCASAFRAAHIIPVPSSFDLGGVDRLLYVGARQLSARCGRHVVAVSLWAALE